MGEKRSRSANFSDDECNILVNIIKEHENIIECKKTDVTTIKDKEYCWEKVTDVFNSKSGVHRRTCRELKMKYENIKRSLKRKVAANKLETTRTGGGIPKIILLTSSEEVVYSMTRLAVGGLPGRFDEDEEYEPPNEPIDIEAADVVYVDDKLIEETSIDTETTSSNWSKWTPVTLRKPLATVLQVKELVATPAENSDVKVNNKDHERKLCVTPNKNSNAKSNERLRKSSFNINSKTPKRYPQLPIESTSALVNAKLELIKLQCAHYNKLLEEMDQQKTKRDLEIQILKVDLEIKLLELKKQTETNKK